MNRAAARSTGILTTICLGLIVFPRPAPAQSLKVSTYNILVGGTGTGQPLSRTAAVITASGADVVGVQESISSIPALATMLGWDYRVFSANYGSEIGNVDNAILSRYPITQTLKSGVRIQTAPGQEAYVFSAHLTPYPYQPYDIRDGIIRTEAQAIAAANAARGNEVTQVLAEVTPYINAGRAVFLTGDMNEPSHLDWTAAAAIARVHAIKVAYPASTRFVAAGLTDSYRVIQTNEVTKPGNTWTPIQSAGEVHDRIDFVYSAGATATNSQVVGEASSRADIVVTPFPSDHRAVVSTFSIAPSSLAPLRTGINLISNAGAEGNPGTTNSSDRVLADWETTATNTRATSQIFGSLPTYPGGGVNYFYGGNTGNTAAETHSISQTLGLADLAALIDVSAATFILSGRFGGFGTQNDTAALTAAFLNADGATLDSITIGNVTAADRANRTILLDRSSAGAIPPLTRSILFNLTFDKPTGSGIFNDGSADNLSFIIQIPEPSLIPLLASLLILRRFRCAEH